MLISSPFFLFAVGATGGEKKNGKNENSTLAPPFETGQRKKRLPPPAEERTPPETEGGTLDWPLGSGAN